jgi:F-type H+-transporting ATPase subunit delta
MPAGVQGESVARNYAEANAIETDLTLYRFLESPRIAADQKSAVLTKALGDRVPRLFLRFLQQLVKNRRQMLIPTVANEYDTLLDASAGIVHARVTVARETADDERDAIAARLSAIVGKTVVPHLAVDPSIIGGVVVRIGDTVMDGSVRRKLALLRRRMGTTRA